MRRISNDHLPCTWNPRRDHVGIGETVRKVLVADDSERWRLDVFESSDCRRVQAQMLRGVPIDVKRLPIHFENQVPYCLRSAALGTARAIDPDSDLPSVYRIHVTRLVGSFHVGKQRSVSLAVV